MTAYGLNPSFCNWISRLPLFADPLRRGKAFEIFREDGTPTGEPSPLGADGWPVVDGRWHGVRLFGDMGGFMPYLNLYGSVDSERVHLRVNPGQSAFLSWKTDVRGDLPGWVVDQLRLKPNFRQWHIPSGEAISYFKPKALRTLDWSMANKRPDWSKPRVMPHDPLQGTDSGMALELQCEAANLLDCHLWWNAPPRFDLPVQEYERRLEELLFVIREQRMGKPPIIEYGNELWNSLFPVRQWIPGREAGEISIMARVARGVFDGGGMLGEKSHYIFVGGHIADVGYLDRVLADLSFTPDLAGPAIYAQPLRTDQARWATATSVSQAELRDSVMANMTNFQQKLDAHRVVARVHGVPYLACYEVGQDMHAHGAAYKNAALQAQREEWMGDVYRELRKMLAASGVDLACWYSAATAQTLDRSFGLLETTPDKAATLPKAKAARGE